MTASTKPRLLGHRNASPGMLFELQRFKSGEIALVQPFERHLAICIFPGAAIKLRVSRAFRKKHGLKKLPVEGISVWGESRVGAAPLKIRLDETGEEIGLEDLPRKVQVEIKSAPWLPKRGGL